MSIGPGLPCGRDVSLLLNRQENLSVKGDPVLQPRRFVDALSYVFSFLCRLP